MRSSTLMATAVALSYACAAHDRPGQPAALSAGASDTIIVNDYGPIPLPVLALDGAGHPLQQALIRYERTSGADLTVSSAGVVTCGRRGDLGVEAVLGSLSKAFVVRCRPIARCTPNLLNDPQRFGCRASAGARVIVSRRSASRDTSAITGYLLVRGFYPPLPPDTASR